MPTGDHHTGTPALFAVEHAFIGIELSAAFRLS
jgi:hypothetical protein